MILYKKDKVRLYSGTELTIENEQDSDNFKGVNYKGIIVPFNEKDIESIKRHYVDCCGGDKVNYWYFYTGPGYQTTEEDVANYAKYELPQFYNMTISEIQHKHIYFGSEGNSYHAFYNGDTYVLFTSLDKLDKDKQQDAKYKIHD